MDVTFNKACDFKLPLAVFGGDAMNSCLCFSWTLEDLLGEQGAQLSYFDPCSGVGGVCRRCAGGGVDGADVILPGRTAIGPLWSPSQVRLMRPRQSRIAKQKILQDCVGSLELRCVFHARSSGITQSVRVRRLSSPGGLSR